ncbi:VIT family protein [Paraglaciecola sp. L3A3]|uniref:VIT1/CCC1 transporter family protein n=1 Tax=Paraglaciecola sp. L3A3 TaxID=2686358 RepID=UPI00131BD11C|nr:VIT family protein [Paraglaciecola sp. L3A3]
MNQYKHHTHLSHRTGWLRAAVMGANDGIVSTASLIVGVAAANTSQQGILIAGLAGLVAGAMSMAAGEYVSVSSQADTEKADLAIEQKSIEQNFEFEQDELSKIYQDRGVEPAIAKQVAQQLMEYDALGAHARDDIGICDTGTAQPVQAALYSAITFTIGAAFPLIIAWLMPLNLLIPLVAIGSLVFLSLLGAIAAKTGGASIFTGAIRVTFWGSLAMASTAGIGQLFSL